ncbi:hypothetical protein E1211_22640 [Micromonospora sp. 15K316]|uniref:hypothetical protein n=1 Tax=Micromonospora sp. 15K316 TaxID=2530376 RepID=UPI001043D452|nr:hypothetical protein [Micromonospora sp. 15K316]TDC31384.1 hypothetical protein E1211_22640 [Micromonospora sp. 15K316]
MSIRYFRNSGGGVSQVGNLTDDGAQVLAAAGHVEITADEYHAAVAAANAALVPADVAQSAAPTTSKSKRRSSAASRR